MTQQQQWHCSTTRDSPATPTASANTPEIVSKDRRLPDPSSRCCRSTVSIQRAQGRESTATKLCAVVFEPLHLSQVHRTMGSTVWLWISLQWLTLQKRFLTCSEVLQTSQEEPLKRRHAITEHHSVALCVSSGSRSHLFASSTEGIKP